MSNSESNINPFAVFNNPPNPPQQQAPLVIPPLPENFGADWHNGETNNNAASVNSQATVRQPNAKRVKVNGSNTNSNSSLSAYNENGPETKTTSQLIERIHQIIEEKHDPWQERFYMNYGNVPMENRISGYNAFLKSHDNEIAKIQRVLAGRNVYVDSYGNEITKEEAEGAAVAVNMSNNSSTFPYAQVAPSTPSASSSSSSAAPWAPARNRRPVLHPLSFLGGPSSGNNLKGRLNVASANNGAARRGTKRKRGNGNGNGNGNGKSNNGNNGYNANLEGGRRKHRHTKKYKCRKSKRKTHRRRAH